MSDEYGSEHEAFKQWCSSIDGLAITPTWNRSQIRQVSETEITEGCWEINGRQTVLNNIINLELEAAWKAWKASAKRLEGRIVKANDPNKEQFQKALNGTGIQMLPNGYALLNPTKTELKIVELYAHVLSRIEPAD